MEERTDDQLSHSIGLAGLTPRGYGFQYGPDDSGGWIWAISQSRSSAGSPAAAAMPRTFCYRSEIVPTVTVSPLNVLTLRSPSVVTESLAI